MSTPALLPLGGSILETYAVSPPRITSAAFTNDLLSIAVTFDKATNRPTNTNCFNLIRASTSSVSSVPSIAATVQALGPAVASHYTLVPSTAGSGFAVCQWTSATRLLITLSKSAKIGAAGTIALVPGAIRAAGAGSLYGACGTVTPTVPATLPAVTAQLFGASPFGPCDDIVVFSTISGTGGRHSVSWSLSAPSSVTSSPLWKASVVAAAESTSAAVFYLPAGSLPDSDEYVLTLTVTGVFGQSATSTFPFTAASLSTPLLAMGVSSISHDVMTELLYRIDVRSPKCDSQSSRKCSCSAVANAWC